MEIANLLAKDNTEAAAAAKILSTLAPSQLLQAIKIQAVAAAKT